MTFPKKLVAFLLIYGIASVALLFYFGSIADLAVERVISGLALFEATKSKESMHAVAIALQFDFFVPAVIAYGVAGGAYLITSFVFFDLPESISKRN
jgi:hypothetical protein